MIDKFIKFRIFFIILLLSFCSIFLESPYHGDYYGDPEYGFYFLITLLNVLVYLMPTDKLIFIEKIVYGGIVSFAVLMLAGVFVGEIMRLIYGYDSNWDEVKSPAILDSSLFYFISNFGGIGIFKIWLEKKIPKKR